MGVLIATIPNHQKTKIKMKTKHTIETIEIILIVALAMCLLFATYLVIQLK